MPTRIFSMLSRKRTVIHTQMFFKFTIYSQSQIDVYLQHLPRGFPLYNVNTDEGWVRLWTKREKQTFQKTRSRRWLRRLKPKNTLCFLASASSTIALISLNLLFSRQIAGGQTKPDMQLWSVSPVHIVHKSQAKFTTGLDEYASQTALPLHDQQDNHLSQF